MAKRTFDSPEEMRDWCRMRSAQMQEPPPGVLDEVRGTLSDMLVDAPGCILEATLTGIAVELERQFGKESRNGRG